MLKYVIKRDGTKEDFDPSKLNKWARWASSDLGDRIDWGHIALDTVKKIQVDTISTAELQKKLIATCMTQRSWPYILMAGKLYATIYRKELYGSDVPTVQQLHIRLIALGLMIDLGYTDDEYTEIESIIDHERDFKLAEFQLAYCRSKYSLSIKKQQFETPQFIYIRMAMTLAKDEPDSETKLKEVKAYYDHFSFNRINPPTPNYVNLGTPNSGLASCCAYSTEDSAESLAAGDHIAYMMTCNSAGIGTLINTRTYGDQVKNGKIEHKGKMPYFKSLAAAVNANVQGSRGGAGTGYFSCYDPEHLLIIMFQNPMTAVDVQIRNMHFAMVYNRFLVVKAAKDQDVFVFTSYTAPKLYELFFSSDEEAFAAEYERLEVDDTFVKHYVPAKDILIAAGNQAYEVSTLYDLQINEVNRHTCFKERIEMSNLCVAPETLILTEEGYKPIVSLKDKEIKIWNGEQYSTTTVRQTGINQKLITITGSSGFVVNCTPYHRFMTCELDKYFQITGYKEKAASELIVGDRLVKYDLPSVVLHGDLEFEYAYESGFFTGDGHNFKQGNTMLKGLDLYHEKKKILPFIKTDGRTVYETRDGRKIKVVYEWDTLFDKFEIPSSDFTLQTRLNWLAGLFDADGTVTHSETTATRSVQLSSVNFGFLFRLRLMLQELGVFSSVKFCDQEGERLLPDGLGNSRYYYCRRLWRILISNNDVIKLINLGLKTNRLILPSNSTKTSTMGYEKIMSITDTGRYDDTYCFTEPLKNQGMFNGALLKNCLEIALPTAPYKNVQDLYKEGDLGYHAEILLCSLAGLVPGNIEDNETYEDAAYYALKMIDKCIHMSTYPFPNLKYTALNRLNAGVGIIGLAYHLAKMGLDFTSQRGLLEIHRVAEKHAYYVIKASLRLGQELGNCPWSDRTKWTDGWLPIDTYKPAVDTIVPHHLLLDWEELRQNIIANKGIRHSGLISHMPSESSSKASGVSNSVYPIRKATLKKTDGSNVVEWCAKDSDILHYQIAWDLSFEQMAKVYAIIQKFTDQSISADFYKDRSKSIEISTDDILNEYFIMVKYGIKSKYYQNSYTVETNEMEDNKIVCVGCVV